MSARRLLPLLMLLAVACGRVTEYHGVGDVVSVDAPRLHVTLRHETIPGFMDAMTMRFAVSSPDVLAGIAPGDRVEFTLRAGRGEPVVTRVSRTTTSTTTATPPGPGVHDHTPHHGGVVGMAGDLHLEALAMPDGTLRVYVTDFWRRPRVLDDVSGSVTVELPEADRTLPLGRTPDALEVVGPPFANAEVTAHFTLTVGGAPVEMDFLLPVHGGGRGAAGVPLRGCAPAPPRVQGDGRGRAPRCVLAFPRAVTALAATPDGSTLLVAAADLGVTAWHLPEGTFVASFAATPPIVVPGPEGLQAHSEAANAIAVSPSGAEALVAVESRLLLYDVASGRLLRQLTAPRGVLRSIAWSPDGTRVLVSAFYHAAAWIVHVADDTVIAQLPVEREAAAVAFAPDGAHAAVGSELGGIMFFDLTGAAPRALSDAHRAVAALAFVDGRLLSATEDGVVRVWDAAHGTLVGQEAGPRSLHALAVAPGGRVAAAGARNGAIRVFATDTGVTQEQLAWHQGLVLSLAWAGNVLASAADTDVVLWDVGNIVSSR